MAEEKLNEPRSGATPFASEGKLTPALNRHMFRYLVAIKCIEGEAMKCKPYVTLPGGYTQGG